MIQTKQNIIRNNGVIVVLSKILSFVVVLFIVSNCAMSSLFIGFSQSSLSEISVIQKDVFSAIFLISGTIEKVNSSLAVKLGLQSNAGNSAKKDNKQPVMPNSSDLIITTAQSQNFKILKFSGDAYNKCLNYNDFYGIYYIFCKGLISVNSIFYFLVMMIFFASSTKMYDIFTINNNKIVYKPTVV